MHISEGILPGQICVAGYAISGGMTWYALRRIKRTTAPQSEMPKAAMLTAAFFGASSLPVPLPFGTVHLVLNGLLGTVLGWYAWPAILVGLLLQALLLGHGGMTTLGINAIIIGGPALLAYGMYTLRTAIPSKPEKSKFGLFSFLAGMTGVGLSVLLYCGFLLLLSSLDIDAAISKSVLITLAVAHLPLIVIEGWFTTLLARFLRKIQPELVKS